MRLDKLPAVGLPRQEHSMNATSDSAKEPDHSSRLWSRELKSDTSTRPPRGREAVRINSDCGGLLIKLLIEYQYSSPNYSAEAPGGTTTLTSAANSISNLSKLDSEEVANAVTICL